MTDTALASCPGVQMRQGFLSGNWDIHTFWGAGNEHWRWPEVFLSTASVTFLPRCVSKDNSFSAPGTEICSQLFTKYLLGSPASLISRCIWLWHMTIETRGFGLCCPSNPQVAAVPHSSFGNINPCLHLRQQQSCPEVLQKGKTNVFKELKQHGSAFKWQQNEINWILIAKHSW